MLHIISTFIHLLKKNLTSKQGTLRGLLKLTLSGIRLWNNAVSYDGYWKLKNLLKKNLQQTNKFIYKDCFCWAVKMLKFCWHLKYFRWFFFSWKVPNNMVSHMKFQKIVLKTHMICIKHEPCITFLWIIIMQTTVNLCHVFLVIPRSNWWSFIFPENQNIIRLVWSNVAKFQGLISLFLTGSYSEINPRWGKKSFSQCSRLLKPIPK